MNQKSPTKLNESRLSPMEAMEILYGDHRDHASREIVDGLLAQIFDRPERRPLGGIRRKLSGFVFWLMRRTTRSEVRIGADGEPSKHFRNRILERSGHSYTRTLLNPGSTSESLVAGGDPMNAIYMMLCPRVARSARLWDLLLLDSVPSRDVQVRFVWETRLTHELASRRLRRGEAVRIKAFAAGTGLSVILAYERLLREGHDPKLIRVVVSDRDPTHREKSLKLVAKLPLLRDTIDHSGSAEHGLLVQVEDIFCPPAQSQSLFHVVTTVGILEYFPGYSVTTTWDRLGEPAPSTKPDAEDLLKIVACQTAEDGHLVASSHREGVASRILEVFGKRFNFRRLEDLHSLAASAGFFPTGTSFSANVYDVAVFQKMAPANTAGKKLHSDGIA